MTMKLKVSRYHLRPMPEPEGGADGQAAAVRAGRAAAAGASRAMAQGAAIVRAELA